MARFSLFLVAILVGCGGCFDQAGNNSDSTRPEPDSETPNNVSSDAGDMGDHDTDENASDAAMDVGLPPNCGDGIVDPGEVCDDGNNDVGDYCARDCTAQTGACGDGVVQTNELCDDNDECSADCQSLLVGSCGDAVVDANETCDDGNSNDGDYCSGDCQAVTGQCGDQAVQTNETCDDGNTIDGDYCAGDCTSVTGSCGDGMTQTNEACDDGNVDAGDYCSVDCLTITGQCGDGILQSNETCDDQTTNDCATTHDGGDGVCVPAGTCSAGYALQNGNCVLINNTGLTEPCQNGSGYTMFRYHYDNGSTSARIDVWDANCSYSFAPGSACNVYEICPGFCDVNTTSQGYPIFTTSHYMRVRFNANGFNFSNATLWIQARSYSVGSSTNFEAWSPIYGSVFGGPVDNDFVYDWYAVDWSNHLSSFDDPNLTAVQLYSQSGSLAVKAVELCVE